MGMMWQKLLATADVGLIEFVGRATAGKVGATSGNSTISLSSGLTGGIASAVSSGDLAIAIFGTASAADRTLSITDGTNPYTLIGSELYANSTYDSNLRVAYKFVSGDTAVTFGPTGNAADGGAMAVYVFRGVDPTTPLDVSVATATGTGSILANPPSITPITSGAKILCIGVGADSIGDQSFSSSSLTEFTSTGGNDSNDVYLGVGYKDDWTSGAFDCPAFTYSTSDDAACSWAAMSIALRPA